MANHIRSHLDNISALHERFNVICVTRDIGRDLLNRSLRRTSV